MPEENGNNTLVDTTEFRVISSSALESLERAEIDVAIATAKRYPRDIAQSIKNCRELALRNQQIAKTCNYAVPRGGKMLVGPSVHFSRIVAYAWGNQAALSRVIGCDRDNAHLQGVFHDLQTNSRIGIEMDWPVQPPRVDSPERWKDQMNLAKRGGSAVALRTAIFNCIPIQLFVDISETAKLVAIGEGRTFVESRNTAVGEFKELGVSQEQLYLYLGIGGLESINTDHLIHLHGVLQSIRDNTLSVVELFGRKEDRFERAKAPGEPSTPKPAATEPKAPQSTSKPKVPPPAEPPADIMDDSEPKKPKAAEKPPEKPKEGPKPEKKPQKTAQTPEPISPSLLDQVRDKLDLAKISEPKMVRWLQAVQVMGMDQTTLDKCSDHYLEMLLGQWDETLELIAGFEQDENPLAEAIGS